MEKLQRHRSSKRARELQLPPSAGQKVFATNDHVDALFHVIDDHCKLVRKVPVPIAQEEVAALTGRMLLLPIQPDVGEVLKSVRHAEATRDDFLVVYSFTRDPPCARAWISELCFRFRILRFRNYAA